MARKKFEEGFKENAIEYCKTHSDKTIKACAAELGIGYSTLRRWIAQSEEQAAATSVATHEDVVVEVSETADIEALPPTEIAPEEITVVDAPKAVIEGEPVTSEPITEEVVVEEVAASVEAKEDTSVQDVYEEALAMQIEAVQEDLDDEFDWVSKRETVKTQLGEFIENAGNGVSDAVQLIGLYKKRRELKKVQKRLQKEKEKRMKQ